MHRERVRRQIDEMAFSLQLLLPWPYEVHHINYNKTCNCDGNLLVVDEALHSVMTADRKRNGDGRFRPKWAPPPAWALFKEDDEGIPF